MPDKDLADNKAYAKAGGYRFEMDQISRIGQALTSLEGQQKMRVRTPHEKAKMENLRNALESVRQDILESRTQAGA